MQQERPGKEGWKMEVKMLEWLDEGNIDRAPKWALLCPKGRVFHALSNAGGERPNRVRIGRGKPEKSPKTPKMREDGLPGRQT